MSFSHNKKILAKVIIADSRLHACFCAVPGEDGPLEALVRMFAANRVVGAAGVASSSNGRPSLT